MFMKPLPIPSAEAQAQYQARAVQQGGGRGRGAAATHATHGMPGQCRKWIGARRTPSRRALPTPLTTSSPPGSPMPCASCTTAPPPSSPAPGPRPCSCAPRTGSGCAALGALCFFAVWCVLHALHATHCANGCGRWPGVFFSVVSLAPTQPCTYALCRPQVTPDWEKYTAKVEADPELVKTLGWVSAH